MGEEQSVCVTGAGGYLASWVVKFLVYRASEILKLASPVSLRGSVIDPESWLYHPLVPLCLTQIGPRDEECWSDLESYKAIQNWYCVAKLIAERAALEYVKGGALNIVTVCPSIIIGPLLQIHHDFQQHISPKVLERWI
ncbi:hypothetical protein ACOSQ2_011660 [Xanthoceras sorbifolium]